MKTIRTLALLAAIAFWGRVVGADDVMLDVSLSFARAEASAVRSGAAAVQAGYAWIFVLDHSGSMNEPDAIVDGKTGFTRWQALLHEFPITVGQIESGSVVRLVKVGDRKAQIGPLLEIKTQSDREALVKTVQGWRKPSEYSLTPLYEGLFLACQEARRLVEKEGRNVCIVVFSDGKDYVGGKRWGEKSYTQADIDAFKPLFSEKSFTACLNWINSSENPVEQPFGKQYVWARPTGGKVVIPAVCLVRPAKTSISLANPVSAGGHANVRVPYLVSISQDRWDSLLAEGFNANISLRPPDGMEIGGDMLRVSRGATSSTVSFRVPASYFHGGKGASFDLSLELPDKNLRSFRFVQPPSVCLSFERQGSVTISSVKPGSGIIAKVGEAISFSAAGTEGAAFAWSFGDGSTANGSRVTHAFRASAPKGVSFAVSAEKPGLVPAKAEGTVVVVEAGVKMGSVPSGLKVGQTAEFTCAGVGEVASYDWFLDGAPVSGSTDARDGSGSKLSVLLDKVGEHKVRVRANMKRVSPEETPDIAFQVAPAPFAVIVKPEANERFAAEAPVVLEASVEGGFASGVWAVKDASGAIVGAPIQSPVVDKVARANFNAPEAGGEFSVTFTAGEGEGAVSATPIRFSAKAKDVRLDIVSPIADARVKTGAPVELKALSKGVLGNVVFVIRADGEEKPVGRPVKIAADGSAALSYEFPVKDGQGERYVFAKTEDGKVVSDPVPFSLQHDAGIILVKPANNAPVSYGGTLDFEAAVSGIANPKDVRWFLRPAGGVEQSIDGGTGVRYVHRFEFVPNRRGLTYEVFARVDLPGGYSLETDHSVVRVSCPDLDPVIVFPGTNGVMRSSFGRRENIDMQVRVRNGLEKFIRSVKWDFGDGTAPECGVRTTARHSYVDYGKDVKVRVVVVCDRCGYEHAAERLLTVEEQPPAAAFAIVPDKNTFDVKSRILLKDASSGDLDRCVWMTNGVVFATCDRGESVELALPARPCEIQIGMRAENDIGASSEAQSRAIRVRYGGWVVVILTLLALLAIGIMAWLFLKNGPAGWKIKLLVEQRPDISSDQSIKAFFKKFEKGYKSGIVGHFWSIKDKFALMPVKKLAKYKESSSLPLKNFAKDCSPMSAIKIGLNNGRPYIKGSPLSADNFFGTNTILGDKTFQAFPQSIEREGRPLNYLFVALDTNHVSHGYVVWFVVLTLAVIAGCAWAMCQYAI